ncbi:hypothetical protein DFJ58DRAFT_759127 [Suillus subalutaceus]|uniref:uncharacterized protein n=1 Tax=Suillus subalutaceus TaxID=48586 RepID=UPI001B87D287|nr:uncharacterized protein DFJ58DRAFT_759127 [Suillus subalutaceus]KAG1873592.1 hypothetical protein DFJ58DRAFT_759127 [Suillus subalutaceus]
MLRKHEGGKLTNRLRVFLKVLARYVAYPLRLTHRLFHTLLQLYSRRRQFTPTQRDEHLERVAGSIQPHILPLSNPTQLQVPPPSGTATNSFVSLLSVHTPVTLANHGQQPAPVHCHPVFRATTPSQVMRYNKNPQIKREVRLVNIPAGKRDYSDAEDSGDWCARVHPEGALYFHDPVRGIYTDSNMRDEPRRSSMTSCIDELLALMTSRCGLELRSGDIELVVELTRGRDHHTRVCRYYFVDHPNRLLFWLDEMPTRRIFDGVLGVEKWSHIKYAIQHQYWQHCEMYPSDKLLGPQLLKELKEVVVHASAEIITTDLSLSPFDADELSKILDLIDRLGDDVQGAHYTCVIVRFMRYFSRAQFFNFCGLPEARLNADQPLFVKEKKSKFLVAFSWAVNVALFDAPRSHMEELRRVWVDRSINSPRWKNFNSKLSSEWSGITMYSTVMVAVDVSFLAVPSVNLQNAGSVTIISTYISLFCIVGSLVVSLFLTRQNRMYGQESADAAVIFLTRVTGSIFGTKSLATVHGLPYAMLLWGMVYFIIAFSYQVFTSTPIITLATTGSACGIVALFTLWLVSAAREFHILPWLQAHLKDKYQTLNRARCGLRP